MKIAVIFLGFLALMLLPQLPLSAQSLNDTIPKKSLFQKIQDHTIKPAITESYKGRASKTSTRDTIPKRSGTSDGPPVSATQDDTTKPGKNQDHPTDNNEDTVIRPQNIPPKSRETRAFVRTVLRRENIFPNKDALALIELLNPGISKLDSVKNDYPLVLPIFPEPDPEVERAVRRAFRDDLRPDANTNNSFSDAIFKLDTLADVFASNDFALADKADIQNYKMIKSLLPKLAELLGKAQKKIDHTSRYTVNTLAKEATALDRLLEKCNTGNILSTENINGIYSLLADMNILLYAITGSRLPIYMENNDSYFSSRTYIYHTVAYAESLKDEDARPDKVYFDEDDPRKFNIYVYRKDQVERLNKRDPEMDKYSISYVIPALENDPVEWITFPDRASTLNCYFPPARFKFSIKDIDTKKIYNATQDLYDASKDRFSLSNFLHPTYKLIFLIPD